MDPAGTIQNERTKLLANALNTACTSCFTVGIATPIAGYIYDVGAFRTHIGLGTLFLAGIGWLTPGETPPRRAAGMNEYFLLAFVVMPVLVMLLGWIAVLLHERSLRRERGES